MQSRLIGSTLSILVVLTLFHPLTFARDLDLEERVRAQQALERVTCSHQIGVELPFQDAVPSEVLRRKVRTYLKLSVALERFWNRSVTSETLRKEMVRMSRHSRMPDRLRELYHALGDDPFLIQECLARPTLVTRLTRNFFARDQEIHAEARREAESLREELARGWFDPFSDHPRRSVLNLIRSDSPGAGDRGRPAEPTGAADSHPHRSLGVSAEEFDRWQAKVPTRRDEIGPLREERGQFVIQVALEKGPKRLKVARFVIPKKPWHSWWAEVEESSDVDSVKAVAVANNSLEALSITAGTCDCGTEDSWDNGSLDDMLEPRHQHSAVWTGSEMIVGEGLPGEYSDYFLNSGGRWHDVPSPGGSWTPTSTGTGPTPRWPIRTTWTGNLMLVWGGYDGAYLGDGARYDPVLDESTSITLLDAPSPRWTRMTIWSGNEMIVWGGIRRCLPGRRCPVRSRAE